ncbi:MAG TPA: non-homologous end-joining DNA ligase [Acidimicrobiales bacterium]|nr:non-homologous end-joining DNA ligase [Acidimicrobiales bacterium]
MFATLATTVPADDEHWAFELKWDGVRALAYLDGTSIHLESRNLNDVTPRYPELEPLAHVLGGRAALLDGEVVAFDEHGKPSFQRLQGRMHLTGERRVASRMPSTPVVYVIFDVLHFDGRSTRDLAWDERRHLLESLELAGPSWQTPRAHLGGGAALLAASAAAGVEGVVAKRRTSPYRPGRRSRDWLKLKNHLRQEVVVGGWVPGAGNRAGRIGALLAGYHDATGLRFAGKVGTGFTGEELDRLGEALGRIERPTTPFVDRVPYRDAHFVEPVVVAEVEFTEWTDAGTMRHPSYKGIRDDKAATDVRRESD